jgi:MoaA/NifB/PqqE/SkfB family radical SAM enzyme
MESARLSIPPPRFLFLPVTRRCNLKCAHCRYWSLDGRDRETDLPLARRIEILEEFSRLSPDGRVPLYGGESTLEPDAYFRLAGACRRLGLRALSIINGTTVRTAADADRMILEGPHEISVSLDSCREKVHDAMRGVPGAFRRAVEGIRLLVESRDRHLEAGARVNVMGLVGDWNHLDLDPFHEFALRVLRVDKLKLGFIQPTFGYRGRIDWHFLRHARLDPVRLCDSLRACDEKYRLGLNPAWIATVGTYFRAVRREQGPARLFRPFRGTGVPICNCYERNVVVDHDGAARFCFTKAYPGVELRRDGDLRAFWEGSDETRQALRSCTKWCGISHAARRETATLASRFPDAGWFSGFGR